jgi:hypothetical protein
MKTLMNEVSFEKGGAVVHIRKKSNVGRYRCTSLKIVRILAFNLY